MRYKTRMKKNQLIRLIVILVLGLGFAAAIAAYQIKSEQESGALTIVKKEEQPSIVSENFGGPFTLTTHTGARVTEKNYEGQWRMIYFGFTYCPAICPTELQKMTLVLNELGEKGETITPIFISVDPERDTVEVMKDYLSLFHPRFIGLTGTVQEIEKAKKGYKIYAAKVQDETMSDYTVDHSSFIYLMDPDNNLRRIFKIQDSAEDIIDFINRTL
ncbi:MAG: SCO family protein [Pseudomonadota bacterium]